MEKNVIEINNIPVIIWGTLSNEVYVYVHGRHSSKEDALCVAEVATKKGLQVISFDFPEHGDRKADNSKRFVIENCVNELKEIIKYVNKRWEKINLFASSIGAYFSLVAYFSIEFNKTLFISPVLDLEQVINDMMICCNVDIDKLEQEKEIDTPMGETLSWEYLQYVKRNKLNKWRGTIKIIIGDNDELTCIEIVRSFKKNFICEVEFIENGKHYNHSEEQNRQIINWIQKNI